MNESSIPSFLLHDILQVRGDATLFWDDKIYQFISFRQEGNKSPLIFVTVLANNSAMIKNYSHMVIKTFTERLLKDVEFNEGSYQQWIVDNFLLDIQNCMKELAGQETDSQIDPPGVSDGAVRQVLNLIDIVKSRMKQRITRPLQQLLSDTYASTFKNLWFEEGAARRINSRNNGKLGRIIEKFNHVTDSVSPELNAAYESLHAVLPQFRHWRRINYRVIKELTNNKSRLGAYKQNTKTLNELRNQLDGMTGHTISIPEFGQQFYNDVEALYDRIKNLVTSDRELMEQINNIQERIENQQTEDTVSSDNRIVIGPYEINHKYSREYFIGEHTGKYIIQGGWGSDYYLFEDAYVAVPLTNYDIINLYRGGQVPPPIVVNTYGPHPFLQDSCRSEQPICMGNTLYSHTNLSPVDRVMYTLEMGKKVLREGHHSLNKNSYYIRMTDPRLVSRIIHKKDLKHHKGVFISRYHKG